MRNHGPSTPPDRRSERGLQFDPAAGELTIGSTTSVVPPGASNRVVLVAYVDLTARSRGRSVAEVFEVRQADIEALAAALDLDAADLAQEIQDVLGATRAEAIRLVSRLRESRVIGGITKAATAGMLAGSLLAGSSAVVAASPAPDGATAPSEAGTSATSGDPVVDGPLIVTEGGVGLVPAVTEERSGAVLIPPANEESDDIVLLPPITVEQDDEPGS
jgi:hypothetical protein